MAKTGLVITGDHLATIDRFEKTPVSFSVKNLDSLPRKWISEIEPRNQGSFSSCVGGGLSGCFEHSNLVETGEFCRRSMWQAYICSQQACGMAGRDNGASLAGAMQAAAEIGCCRNEFCPMPNSYTTSIPKAALEDAKKHKHVTVTWDARPWEKAIDWATNKDPILIGGLWTNRHSTINANNPIETPWVYSGSSLGYHCRQLCGYIFIDGKLHLAIRNTHGAEFGINGVSYVPEETWAVLCRDPNFVACAFGDTEEIEPVRRTWEESKAGDSC